MDKETKSSTERRGWNALVAYRQKIRDLHLRTLLADDPTRGERTTLERMEGS
jgi:glucose-6-phosphate isomerase